jgi:bifunctional N-acetylglucosamine-1-phosphate-uridyltransferase/glucosamine-1-phosphate-acetyltransferase GlmU-like protein
VLTDATGAVQRVVEWKDATEAERSVTLCNAGVICADAARLFPWLDAVGNDNAAGEYYLPDVVGLAVTQGQRCIAIEAPEAELRGINSRAELAQAEAELQARFDDAGVMVEEAKLSHLAYAPEIAQVMLRRQQAEAIVSARARIVHGAVSMVEAALQGLSERKIVELDDERKAAMVSNLLVVLCSDKETQPIINTGTLYG